MRGGFRAIPGGRRQETRWREHPEKPSGRNTCQIRAEVCRAPRNSTDTLVPRPPGVWGSSSVRGTGQDCMGVAGCPPAQTAQTEGPSCSSQLPGSPSFPQPQTPAGQRGTQRLLIPATPPSPRGRGLGPNHRDSSNEQRLCQVFPGDKHLNSVRGVGGQSQLLVFTCSLHLHHALSNPENMRLLLQTLDCSGWSQ